MRFLWIALGFLLAVGACYGSFRQGRYYGNLDVWHAGYNSGYNSGVTDAYVAYKSGGMDAVQVVVDKEEADYQARRRGK